MEIRTESMAFVIFNVKGKDLMAIDRPNDFRPTARVKKSVLLQSTEALGLATVPFKNVKYFVPYTDPKSPKQSTYLTKEEIKDNIGAGRAEEVQIHLFG